MGTGYIHGTPRVGFTHCCAERMGAHLDACRLAALASACRHVMTRRCVLMPLLQSDGKSSEHDRFCVAFFAFVANQIQLWLGNNYA